MQKIVAVRDSALEEFMNPFVAPSQGIAIRSFSDEVNRKDSPMFAHPGDYELFELGEYDSSTGKVICHSSPKSLLRGSQAVVNSNDELLPRPVKLAK